MAERTERGAWRKVRSIGIERERQVYFFEYDEGPPNPGQFRVDTLYTGLSAGTELTFYKGTNPYLHSRWDEGFGVFRQGEPSARYPIPFLGYMEVGQVTESLAPDVPEGQILAMNYGHKTGHTAHPHHDFYIPLPDGVDPVLGIYGQQMGPICANGLLHAAADVAGANVQTLGDGVRGRNVLVIGAGVVGLLTALFAKLHGAAQVAIADVTPSRLKAARDLGLLPIDENQIEGWRWCKENWHHGGNDRGADVVFQCRATSINLANGLRALRPQGTVIDLSFYQGGATELNLGEEFHHNGLSIRSAQINRVPRGLQYTWTRRRLSEETIRLLCEYGKLIRRHIITDIVPYDDAPTIFEELNSRQRDAIQIVFKV
jgi:threonine dehydrogenase-like Zn-dependent dehydrogenase